MRRTFEDAREWTAAGTELFLGTVAGWDEEDYSAPSALPEWTRKHLVAHVAANADALGNLVHWAATGEETPMYVSRERRNAAIEEGARKPGAELAAWLRESADRLAERIAALTPEQRKAEVRNGQGELMPATEIPWYRSREVLVHTVDLAAGVSFADLPAGFLTALADDIATRRARTPGTAVVLTAEDTGDRWELPGDDTAGGDAAEVGGPVAEIAAYLAGRPHALTAPPLPAWL